MLSILACPQDKGPLLLIGAADSAPFPDGGLYNPRLRRLYPVENGIPVLLIDEAVDVGENDHEALVARQTGAGGS
nr:Trm112 family protein [Rhodococcus sp. HNM0569]